MANRWILFAIAVAIAAGSGLVFGKQMYAVIEIRDTAARMLDHVKNGDYREASRFIAYYTENNKIDSSSSPSIDAGNAWVSRMETLDAEITGYDKLEVWMEDGKPKGRVTLHYRQGDSEIVEQTPISFLKRDGEWKISGFPFLKDENVGQALSGYISD
ncbi:hypothetical protein [Bacillus marinisedimentorum]|uniref:hypothetical protein n=1 Tax=Bacillus marinisedimentorum TaxID=1821260 RepID=UPI0014717CD3|nr:hypothetical protein [Bacillus marinisedimentorum]